MNLDKELMIVLCIIIATFLLIGNYAIFLKMEKYEHVGDNWGQLALSILRIHIKKKRKCNISTRY